jgi:L-ascorbate metabolism protein UlaG (beta-lactamase superfamily)
MIFYIDPRLRRGEAVLDPASITHADLVLATHKHESHLDAETLPALMEASRRAKLVLPKSAVERACALGIGHDRMTTTDAGLRVECFKDGNYVRVYAAPSAHVKLDWSAMGGYPYLGYLLRAGPYTIYHSGDCVPHEDLVPRLLPYNVTVALLPIAGRGNFTIEQAAATAAEIGARWLVPMHYSEGDGCTQRFVDHMLFRCPEQRFKVFRRGEGWPIPEDDWESGAH